MKQDHERGEARSRERRSKNTREKQDHKISKITREARSQEKQDHKRRETYSEAV
jgi:hypothetical protein